MRETLSWLFGGKAQLVVGILSFVVGVAAWVWWGVIERPTTAAIFHVSMYFGCVACYAIIATALGYRATERVEQVVVENLDVEVES